MYSFRHWLLYWSMYIPHLQSYIPCISNFCLSLIFKIMFKQYLMVYRKKKLTKLVIFPLKRYYMCLLIEWIEMQIIWNKYKQCPSPQRLSCSEKIINTFPLSRFIIFFIDNCSKGCIINRYFVLCGLCVLFSNRQDIKKFSKSSTMTWFITAKLDRNGKIYFLKWHITFIPICSSNECSETCLYFLFIQKGQTSN